jgi:hypothetical protein
MKQIVDRLVRDMRWRLSAAGARYEPPDLDSRLPAEVRQRLEALERRAPGRARPGDTSKERLP